MDAAVGRCERQQARLRHEIMTAWVLGERKLNSTSMQRLVNAPGGSEKADGGARAPPPMPESGMSWRRKSVMNWQVAASSSNLRVSTHRAVQL